MFRHVTAIADVTAVILTAAPAATPALADPSPPCANCSDVQIPPDVIARMPAPEDTVIVRPDFAFTVTHRISSEGVGDLPWPMGRSGPRGIAPRVVPRRGSMRGLACTSRTGVSLF
jgi:hypothetical protein